MVAQPLKLGMEGEVDGEVPGGSCMVVHGAKEEEVGCVFSALATVAVEVGFLVCPPVVSRQGAPAQEKLAEGVKPATFGPQGASDELE